MKDVLDLFKEQGTRDELGLSTIRDAFADALFPGTGALQTRARYFFFIPWMYKALEDRKVPSAEIDRKARRYEVELIEVLLKSGDVEGTIGRQSRAALQRLPSSIYWSGLGVLHFRQFPGSQDQYHRSLDRYYRLRRGVRNDDGEPVDEIAPNWASMPSPPADFPSAAAFALRPDEAAYLSERIMSAAPASLLAFLVRETTNRAEGIFPWEKGLLERVTPTIRRQLEHARNFSLVMLGASLLYNRMLSELVNQAEWVDAYRVAFAEWGAEMKASGAMFEARPLDDLWRCTEDTGAAIRMPTRQFVTQWVDMATAAARPESLADAPTARSLIRQREIFLKKALARLDNARARELWNGAAGVGRLTYRWPNARVVCGDIFAGRKD